jgi:hypothetical protein
MRSMINPTSTVRTVLASLVPILFSASVCSGQSLSKYRGFQLGSTTESVLTRVGMNASDVRTIHTQPAVLEELEWNPQPFSSGPSISESLRQIRFSFLNGELYKMVVGYDYFQTEGLTTEDVIDAVSSQYGKATVPAAATMVSAGSASFEDSQKVFAVWEDADNAYSLFRSGGAFGLVIVAKQQNIAANTAAAESVIRERSEAPQKELDRRVQAEKERQASQEKARLINKPKFRP